MLSPDPTEAERVRLVVLQILADQDRLLSDETRLTELPVFRNGQYCGIHYSLRGPRDMLLTAIWDAQTHTLWCYDSRGQRFAHQGLGQQSKD